MQNTTRRLAKVTMYAGAPAAIALLAVASSLQSAMPALSPPNVAATLAKVADAVAPAPRAVTPAKRAAANPALRRLPAVVSTAATAEVSRRQGGNPAPRYPEMLRSAEVEGVVVVTFSTDGLGVPDTATLTVVRSTHDLFTNSVRAALARWHLAPNTTIQLPFVFRMANTTTPEPTMDGVSFANAVVITTLPASAPPGSDKLGPAGVPWGGKTVIDSTTNRPYFEFQVQKSTTPIPQSLGLKYPEMLRSANVEGEVLAQFVVGADGVPDVSTFKVLRSTHELFSQAVRDALADMRFEPATVGGKAVKQLKQMPFTFSLNKKPN